MIYPLVTVVITTLDRVTLLYDTLLKLKEQLIYSGPIEYVLANDGAYEPLAEMVNRLGFKDVIRIVGDGERHGLGGNTNRGLRDSRSDIVLQTQDDYHLTRALEINPMVETLLNDDTTGWIRLRLTAGQGFTATIQGRYWEIAWSSEGLYIASDQPHIKNWRRFHGFYGLYRENLDITNTENEFCGRVRDMGREHQDGPKVLIPVFIPDNSWVHMGDDISLKDRGF